MKQTGGHRRRAVVLKVLFLLPLLALGLLGPAVAQSRTHRVAPGDTLYSIARTYSVSVDALQSANGITDPSRIRVGQDLQIPTSAAPSGSTTSAIAAQSPATETNYKVVPGDTYYSIARTHGMAVADLLSLNGRNADQILRVGEELMVRSAAASIASRTNGSGNTQTTNQGTSPAAGGQTTTVTVEQTTRVSVTPPSTAGTLLGSKLVTDGAGTTWPLDGERYEFSGKFPGIAIVAERGSEVHSVTSGTVIYSGPHSTLGQVVFIQHPRGYVYIYGGNETLTVQTGQEVSGGQTIAKLGVTQALQRAQLFFSVWKDGGYIDPRTAPR